MNKPVDERTVVPRPQGLPGCPREPVEGIDEIDGYCGATTEGTG